MRTVLVGLLLLTASTSAFDVELRPQDLTEAVSLGQTGIESQRADFHRPYRLLVNEPPLDYIEVVTPFRRIVLAAEARLRAGERLFGQREALEVLGDRPDAVELRLELTFHPLNTFVGVPAYEVDLLTPDGRIVQPMVSSRIPRFGPRVDGQITPTPTQGVGIVRGPSQPLLGGTVIATFDGRLIGGPGIYEVRVQEGGRVVASKRMAPSGLR